MEIVTKDLLINFLFILLALFLVHMIYMVKYAYRLKNFKGWMVALFPVISLVLCMLFPVYDNQDFIWDLRWIPFVLGGLYGGYRLGFLLLFLVISIRFFQGGDGFFVSTLTFSTLGIVISFLSKYYLNMTTKHKTAVSISLTVAGVLATMFVSQIFFNNHFTASFWLIYLAIYVIGTLICTLLWEVITTNFAVLDDLIQAEKKQTVSHLAASISHEVRNPLTVTRGFIQLLSGDVSPDLRKEYADIALKELDRATEVINDYLTFAKPVLEKMEKININEEMRHAINVITPLATMNGVQVQFSLLEQDYFTKGNSKRFQQCLINILKNGVEAIQDHGKLKITQNYADGIIKIEIQDEGTGMTKEQIGRLGEPYFSTKEKGTGLGMMVSYSIIRGMDGTINVKSEPGLGTCFTIKLPIYE